MPIQGTVPVGGSFAPTDSADSFGTHNDKWGIGGHRVVKTITDRNGIPVNESGLLNLDDELASGRRKLGMFVYVSDEDKFYILKVDQVTWDGYNEGQKVAALAEDDNWVEFVGGGGADTGNIGFENNWIKNTVGEEIYISPQDGYTWLWLPSDTNAAAGDYVNLANTHPDGGGVYITTNAGSWQFKNDGILQVPGRISFGGIDWQSIGVGNVNSHGGSYGISLYCTVGYELNWQAGYLSARDYLSPYDIIDIRSDSLIKYTTPPDYTIFHATFDDDTLITKKYLEDKGYLTSFTESDPVFSGSAAFGITSTQITNWDTAYGWGNHANAGYLTDAPSDGKTYGRKNATWSEVVTTGGGIPKGTASGTDTYTVTITGVTAYNDGDAYLIRFPNGNTTSATLNINSLGAKTLFRNNDGPLIGGDIFSGGEMLCIYNSTLNGFQCIGSSPNSLFAYVTNGEASTISRGQVVYASGGTGDRMVVMLANNSQDSTSAKTVGVVYSTSIGANQKGIILMQGLIDGLSLPTATWSDGDSVYLGSTAGSITKTKPFAPNHLVYVATVTTASNGNGRMYVKIQNGYELEELHDVDLITNAPAAGQFLRFDGTLWKNSASTLALSGNTSIGSSTHTVTFVTSGNTSVTLPTSGTVISTVTNMAANPVTGTPSSSNFLRGDGTWAAGVGTGSVASGTGRRLALYTANGTGLGDSLDAAATRVVIAAHATGREYTIPDSGAAASFVMTAGTQTIGGTKTLTSPSITTSLVTSSTSFDLLNTTATTINMGGAATTFTLGNTTTSAQTVNLFNSATTAASTYTMFGGATGTGATKNVNIGTNGTSGSNNNIAIGSAVAGALGSITLNQNTSFAFAGSTTSPQITISGTTLQWIFFNSSSLLAAPSTSTRSNGTKIVLIPGITNNLDYALGMESGAMWISTGNGTLKFYNGNSTVSSGQFEYTSTAGSGVRGLRLNAALSDMSVAQLVIGSTSNGGFISFGSGAINLPAFVGTSFSTRSSGTKIVLYDGVANSTNLDYALGVATGSLWITSGGGSINFYTNNSTTVRATISSTGLTLSTGSVLTIGANQVVGARITGWGTPGGTLTKATIAADAAAAPTQAEFNALAQNVRALITDLRTHGLIAT